MDPQPQIAISPAEAEICEGGEILLTTTVSGGNIPNAAYKWQKDGVDVDDYFNSYFTDTPDADAEYTVIFYQRYTDDPMGPVGTCEAEATAVVTVAEDPEIESVKITPEVDTICTGTQITVQAEGTFSDDTEFTWYRNGVLMEGITGSSFTETLTAEGYVAGYSYTAVATRPVSGCASEPQVSNNIYVRPMPSVQITGQQEVCEAASGNNIILVANINDDHGLTYTYSWRENNSSVVGEAEYKANKPAGEYEYVVMITNPQTGCYAYSDPFTVTVAPGITVSIPTPADFCEGAEVTLEAQMPNATNTENINYAWSSGEQTATITTAPVNASTTYNLTVTDVVSGCTAEASINLVPQEMPELTLSIDPTAICYGAQVTPRANLSSAASTITETPTYHWTRNGQQIEGVTGASFTETPNTFDNEATQFTYAVYATLSGLACVSNTESAVVTVHPNPTVEITGDAILCEVGTQNTVNLTAVLNDQLDGLTYTYTWRIDNVDQTPQGVTFSKELTARDNPYVFTVVVESSNGCSVTSEPYNVYVNREINVEVTSTSTEVCSGVEVTMTANVGGNFSDLTYRWYTVTSGSETLIPGANGRTYTVNPTETTQYRVRVLQGESFCEASGDITINITTTLPTLTLNGPADPALCDGGQITINAVVGPEGVTGTYAWTKNNVPVDNTTATMIDSPVTVDNDETEYIYTVTFTQDNTGCEVSRSTTITVEPNITVVLSGDQIICDGDYAQLVANIQGYDNNGTMTQTWYVNNSVITSPSTTEYNRNMIEFTDSEARNAQDEPYMYSVEISRGNGCTTRSEEYPVYVMAKPVVTISADDTTICENGTITFTANLNNNNASDITYKWYLDGTRIQGATSTTYTPTLSEGEHIIVVEARQTTSNCFGRDTMTVTVNALPELTVEVDRDSVCGGQQVVVTATPNNGVNDEEYVYTWYRNGQIIAGANTNVLYDTPEASADLTMYVYGAAVSQASAGCISAIVYDTLYVRPNPTIAISGDALYCNNGDITLTANVNDYDEEHMGTLTYQWRLGNADITGQTTTTLTDNQPAADEPYIYTIVATNSTTGCSVTSDPYYVYVNNDVTVEVTSSVDSLCQGGEVTFTANLGDYNASNLTYRWYLGDNTPIFGATGRTLTVAPSTVGENVYKVEVLQTTSQCTASGNDTVFVIAAPQLALILNNAMVCSGGEINLQAIANQTGSFQWYKNEVRIEGANQATLHDSPIAIDDDSTYYTYGVVFTSDVEGCQATMDTMVKAYPNPIVVITGDPIICDGTNVVLHANVDGYDTTTVNLNYQWLVGNTRISGANTNELTYTAADSTDPYIFTVQVYDTNGCRSYSEGYPVYVNDSITVAITVDDTTICENGTVTLTAQLGDYNDNALVYQWFNDGTEIEGATSRTLTTTVAETTTFSVRVNQTTSGCFAEGTREITVAPVPEIESITLSETSVCTGYQILVSATIDASNPGVAGDPYTYTWYRNGVLLDGVNSSSFYDAPVISGVTPQEFVYSVVVSQQSSACESAEFTATDILTVHPMPTVVVAGDQQLCFGQEVELFAHVQNDDATPFNTTTYEWLVDNNVTGIPGFLDGGQTIYYHENITRPAMDEAYMFSVRINRGPGCVVTSEPLAVTIYNAPVVNVTAEETEVCTNGTTVLTAHIDNYNIEDLTFQWYKDATTPSNMIAGANEITYTTEALEATTSFFVVVTQTTTTCADTAEIEITVNEVPEITSITLSAEDICRGAQVTVSATTTGGVTGDPYTYTWYRNGILLDGVLTASFVDEPTLSDIDANSFVYTAIVSQPSSGCVSDSLSSNELHVYQNPTVEISGDAILCHNTNVELTAHINDDNAATGTLTYQWRSYNEDITGETNNTLSQTVTAQDEPYLYTVQISNENGCTTVSEPYAVYVNDEVTVEVTSTEDSICAGGVVTLTANLGDYNASNLVYRWYTVEGGTETMISGATSRTLQVHPTETTNYLVRVMQTTSECQAEGTYEIRVIEAPEVALTLTPDSVICAGGQITLTATVVGEGTYAWYKNQQLVDGADQNTLTDSPLAVDNDVTSYNYAVIFTPNIEGCVSTTVDTVVTVHPNHTVEISGDPIVCTTNEVSLTANISNGVEDATYAYQWMLANANIAGATSETYTDNYTASDNAYIFTVSVTNELSGCSAVSAPFYVYVNANPIVEVTATENTVCAGGQTTLTAHLGDYNQPNLAYQWYAGSVEPANAIAGATEPTFTTSLDGTTTFYLQVTQTTSDCSANGNITITHCC